MMKYKLLNDDIQKTYALVLESGEEVMACLNDFAGKNDIHSARFSAIGAFSHTTVGFFDFSIKDYKKNVFDEQMEVLTITGDISTYKGKIKIHTHAVLGRKDGTAHGGHLLKAIVHPTLEIIVTSSVPYLERAMDADSGIPLIKL
ncbi:MAG TPA: PPC domain-containing DNA-binding protein [Chitinophagaceae bacterium]|nr:PPC domain-containing DNA-binding protein [Chitinophagaceae bacterium]